MKEESLQLEEEQQQDMIDNKHYTWNEVENYVLNKNKEEIYYADPDSNKPPFSVIMPPPNVTGYLHMGHALVTTLQDVTVRYKRMKGFDVLWQAGVDHAGIATQVVVEKQLAEKGLDRRSLGREAFIEKVYEWKETSAGKIMEQIKRMGSSCDFSYLAFTMDEQSIKGVNHAFVKLFEAGLIYQDDRLVNWDSKLQTAISDLEVETKEVKGCFYYLRYKLVDSDDYLIIATTRPETLFGDTAIAVNPKDERYINLIGKEVFVPIVNRKIKIIADSYADMEKGSGAVKITPAHDFNDFEVGKRNNLEILNILNKDGTLNENTPEEYIGLSVSSARKKLVEALKSLDLVEKIEENIMSIPYGDRTGVVVEPLLTKQWFLDAEFLAKDAIEAVKSGKIEFVPDNWKNLYFDWMENIRPWCISRQLWWGHRIPVYYGEDAKVFVAENRMQAEIDAEKHYGKKVDLRQDEDVLDTWFSSGLWSFLTLGWPDNTERLERYYPTSLLVTAFDIIFFWVARMIMMSTFFMKEVPFRKIYIHALIRDEKGQKMSKSKGNVIDPLSMIDTYGTDALRFALVAYSGQGRDIKLSEKTIEGYRNFVTKIWNSYKFCKQNELQYNKDFDGKSASLEINQWILSRLQNLQHSVDKSFDEYKFNEIASGIYQFIWRDYCDLYIEFTKSILYSETESFEAKQEIRHVMGYVFDAILKIIHPIMPFISDYLYENLHADNTKLISLEEYPIFDFNFDSKIIDNVDNIIDFVGKIRKIRVDLNISPALFLNVSFSGSNIPDFIMNNFEVVKKMARLEGITTIDSLNSSFVQDVVSENIFGISVVGVVDTQKERERLEKSKSKQLSELQKILDKLNNKAFLDKAQPQVIASFEEQKALIEDKIRKVDEILSKLG